MNDIDLLSLLEQAEKNALMKKNSTLLNESTKKQGFGYYSRALTHFSISHGTLRGGLKSSIKIHHFQPLKVSDKMGSITPVSSRSESDISNVLVDDKHKGAQKKSNGLLASANPII